MTGQAEKDHVLGDYAAFLKALLPQAQGFLCHDTAGRLFWSELPPDGPPSLGDAYRAVLAATLRGEAPAPEAARLPLGPYTAYVLPLAGEAGRVLGALTVLVDRGGAAMPHGFVRDLLGPALRSLQRELSLRFRLLDGQRKLAVQAAEERLLHQVEKILHERQACDPALRRILALCCEHLGTEGALLVIPDKRICLVEGAAPGASEAERLCAALVAEARAPGFDTHAATERDDLFWLTIHQRGREVQGVFALQGWRRSEFSQRRLARVSRYIGSHVETVLDRDYDALTGLMAWPVFERELAEAGAAAGGEGHLVMCLDVDQLHVINDTFGRDAGDEVLVSFAAILRELLPGHPVSRVTGDNFAALLRDTSFEQARDVGEEICARFREHVYVRGDQTHRPTVSIGVGPWSTDAPDAPGGGGLAAAQVACKAAKERGRARVEVYEPADLSIVRRVDDIQIVGYVRNAIENGRLALMGQPLRPLKAGRVSNYFEVLVRLVDERGRHVPPAEFISAAERYQLMEELDRWVVENTLQLVAGAADRLVPGRARFAINLSGQSLGSDSFLPFVTAAIARSGVAPELIAFEITESVAVARMQQAQAFMHALKKIGCRFSLDDFGTGLSSFAYLKLFPVDTLKIDGSFVRDITSNLVSQSVVAAIAEVARVMQLETVAEYVQDDAALALLRNLNISYAQGYLVGKAELLERQIAAIGTDAAVGVQ